MLYSVKTVLKKENTLFSQKNNNKKKIQVPVLKGLIMLDQMQNILQRY